MTWLLKRNSEIVEVTCMHDWLGIRLLCLRVVTWLLDECHANEIEVTDMNDWVSVR